MNEEDRYVGVWNVEPEREREFLRRESHEAQVGIMVMVVAICYILVTVYR